MTNSSTKNCTIKFVSKPYTSRQCFFFSPWHFFVPVANLVLKIATAIFGLPRALFSKFATGNRESFTGTFFKFATAKLVCHGQFWTTNCHGQLFGFTGNCIVNFLLFLYWKFYCPQKLTHRETDKQTNTLTLRLFCVAKRSVLHGKFSLLSNFPVFWVHELKLVSWANWFLAPVCTAERILALKLVSTRGHSWTTVKPEHWKYWT